MCYFWVLEEEPHDGMFLLARRRVTDQPSFWALFELPGGDELPPGDTSCFGSILGSSVFWVIFNRGKGCLGH